MNQGLGLSVLVVLLLLDKETFFGGFSQLILVSFSHLHALSLTLPTPSYEDVDLFLQIISNYRFFFPQSFFSLELLGHFFQTLT